MIATLVRLMFSLMFQLATVALRAAILLGAIFGRLLIIVLSMILKWLRRNGDQVNPSAPAMPPASKPNAPLLPEFKPRPLHPPRRSR